jgi:hypothetical protein
VLRAVIALHPDIIGCNDIRRCLPFWFDSHSRGYFQNTGKSVVKETQVLRDTMETVIETDYMFR